MWQNVPRETGMKENRGCELVISSRGVKKAVLRIEKPRREAWRVSYKYT